MRERVTALSARIAHAITLAVGICLLPVALLARQFGITIPVHRLIERTGEGA